MSGRQDASHVCAAVQHLQAMSVCRDLQAPEFLVVNKHGSHTVVNTTSHNHFQVAALAAKMHSTLTGIEVHVLQGVPRSLQGLYDVLMHAHIDFRVRQVVACTGRRVRCTAASTDLEQLSGGPAAAPAQGRAAGPQSISADVCIA